MNDKLVLDETDLFSSIKKISTINDTFQLGVGDDLPLLSQSINDARETLRNPNIGDANSLLYAALAKRSEDPEQLFQSPISKADVWRELGYPDIALIFEDWYALADDVKIKMINQGTEDEYPKISNTSAINKKCRELDRRLDPLVENLAFTPNDIMKLLCDLFALDLRPSHKFREYWIDRIVNAPGFAKYDPSRDEDGLPDHEPFGWLTKRHVKALKAHGYAYKFAFWQEPVGDTRGHLWVQTDRGPLVLSDKTDSVSLKTNFPVQVSNLAKRKKFKLRKRNLERRPTGGNLLLRLFSKK